VVANATPTGRLFYFLHQEATWINHVRQGKEAVKKNWSIKARNPKGEN
jgi:hypothetical protein